MKETVDFSKLINDAINGDDAASKELYRLTHKTAYHSASLLLKNHDDIQDVLQNSYMKAFQKLPEIKNPESFESWIKSIVENECKNYIKKEKRISLPIIFFKNKAEKHSEEWNQPVPQEYMEREELRKSISDILDRLSPEIRACIVLFHYEDKSLNDISEILDIPPGTVKSRLHNGRKQIEKEFNKLRKKDPTLYGIGAIPVMLSLMSYQAKNAAVPAAISECILSSSAGTAVSGATAASAASAGGAAASTAVTATSAAASTAAGSAATTAAASIAVKVAAVAVAGSVVAGGSVAVKNRIENQISAKETTVYSSTLKTEEAGTVAQIIPESSTSAELSTMMMTDVLPTSQSSAPATTQNEEKSTANQTVKETTEINKTTTAKHTSTAASTQKATTTEKQTATQKPSTTKAASTAAPTTNPENNYGASGGVITEYTGSDPYVTIPSSVNGNSVTAVGSGAFSGNTDIRSVSMPSTVTQIGQEAFADCTSLASVTMPSSLKLIGIGAFYGCSSLTSVSIPSGTQTISDEAFAQCTSLKTVTVPSSVTEIADDAFDGCDSLTIRCEEGSAAHDFAVDNGIDFTLI